MKNLRILTGGPMISQCGEDGRNNKHVFHKHGLHILMYILTICEHYSSLDVNRQLKNKLKVHHRITIIQFMVYGNSSPL